MIPIFQLLTTKPPLGSADGEVANPDGVAGFLAVLDALHHDKPDLHAKTGTEDATDPPGQPPVDMPGLQAPIPLQPVFTKGQVAEAMVETTPAEIATDAQTTVLEMQARAADSSPDSSADTPPTLTPMTATDSKAASKPVDVSAQVGAPDEIPASARLSASPAPSADPQPAAKALDPGSGSAAAPGPESGLGQPAKPAAKPAKASLVEASLHLRFTAPEAMAADADAAPTIEPPEAAAPLSDAPKPTVSASPDAVIRPSGEAIATATPDPFSTNDLLSVLSMQVQHRLTSGKVAATGSQQRQSVDLSQVPQTVAQVVLRGEQQTEVNLHPAELGRLRFAIQHQGDKLTVILSAEQAGTLSLLRRNADELIAELAASGFKDASLSFGQWNESGQGSSAQGGNGQGQMPEQDLLLVSTPRIYPAKTAGLKGQSLDLKL